MNELKEKLEPGSTEKDTKKKDTSKTKARIETSVVGDTNQALQVKLTLQGPTEYG